MDLMEPVKLRRLTINDLDAVTEIDKSLLGKMRRDYWEAKLNYVDKLSPVPSLVAEAEGKVVGFILGGSEDTLTHRGKTPSLSTVSCRR